MTTSTLAHASEPCALANYASVREDPIVCRAIGVLEERLFQRGAALTSPNDVRQYLRLRLASEALEVFAVVFLDSQHCVIACETLFQGTIDGACVYPRTVIKRVIEHNSAAVIFAHNHPSGLTEPSPADLRITKKLQSALELIDVPVLDHLIVGAGQPFSFAEAGLL